MKKNLLLLLLLPFWVSAQSSYDSAELAFFERQSVAFSEWLAGEGLSEVLYVRKWEADNDTLTIYLGFSDTEDADSVDAQWRMLQASYLERGGLSLEQSLYQRWRLLTEVPPTRAYVALSNTYTPGVAKCFYKVCYFERGFQLYSSTGCKSRSFDIVLPTVQLRPQLAAIQVNGEASEERKREVIFNELEKEFRSYFSKQAADGEQAVIERVDDPAQLWLHVYNIRRTVLTDEVNPILADLVGQDWAKREYLEIIISHKLENGMVTLSCEVNGKYGSGIWMPQKGAYMEMTPRFKGQLDAFVKKFESKIKQTIKK